MGRVNALMRRLMFRSISIFLVVVGLIVLSYPFLALFVSSGSELPLDTRAYFRAGAQAAVPSVTAVNCSAQEYGTSIRNGRLRVWKCQLTLGYAATPPVSGMPADPDAGSTRAGTNAKFQRYLSTLAIRNLTTQSGPSTLERELPFDYSGVLPTLRQMSKEGEPLEYGVVWGGRELATRWLMWALLSLLMWAFGGAAMYAAKVGWGRS